MRTIGRTDMPKLIVDLRNFAKEPKNCEKYLRSSYSIAWYLGSYFEKRTEEASFVTLRAPKEKRLRRNKGRTSRCLRVGTINRQRKCRNTVRKPVKRDHLLYREYNKVAPTHCRLVTTNQAPIQQAPQSPRLYSRPKCQANCIPIAFFTGSHYFSKLPAFTAWMANYEPAFCRTRSVGAFSKDKGGRRVKLTIDLQNSSKRNRIFISDHLPPSVRQAYYPAGSTACFLVGKGGRRVIACCLPPHGVRLPLSPWRSSKHTAMPDTINNLLPPHAFRGRKASHVSIPEYKRWPPQRYMPDVWSGWPITSCANGVNRSDGYHLRGKPNTEPE
jgi:hypothetical protein